MAKINEPMTASEICELTGYSDPTVNRAIKATGVSRKRIGRVYVYTPEAAEEICQWISDNVGSPRNRAKRETSPSVEWRDDFSQRLDAIVSALEEIKEAVMADQMQLSDVFNEFVQNAQSQGKDAEL